MAYTNLQQGKRLASASAQRENFEGFVPDRSAFDAQIQAQLDQYLAQLPVAQNQFNADLASRGIFGAGEAPKFLYSDVYAPIARAGAQAITQSNVQFEQLSQQGRITQAQLQQQADQFNRQLRAQKQAALWSGIGGLVGTGLGALLGGGGGSNG